MRYNTTLLPDFQLLFTDCRKKFRVTQRIAMRANFYECTAVISYFLISIYLFSWFSGCVWQFVAVFVVADVASACGQLTVSAFVHLWSAVVCNNDKMHKRRRKNNKNSTPIHCRYKFIQLYIYTYMYIHIFIYIYVQPIKFDLDWSICELVCVWQFSIS